MFEIFTQMWTFNRIFAFSHTSIKNSTEVNKEQWGGVKEKYVKILVPYL